MMSNLGTEEFKDTDPPEGFGGDGGCSHPQCALQIGIEAAAESVVQGMCAMAFAEWDLSAPTIERLRALASFVTACLDDDERIAAEESIGVVHPLPKDKER